MKGLRELDGAIFLYGSDFHVYAFVADSLSKIHRRDVIVYFEDDIKARAVHRVIEDSAYIAPENRVFGASFSHSREDEANRSETLLRLSQKDRSPVTLFCSAVCALEKFPALKEETMSYSLAVGEHISLSGLFNFLYDNGYEKVSYIAQKCELSVRGGIIDVFSPMHEQPLRIELFGDEIVSIRYFDLATQTSVAKISSCVLYGAQGFASARHHGREGIPGELHPKADAEVPLESYCNEPIVFLVGAGAIVKRLRQNEEEFLLRTTEFFFQDEELSPAALLQQEGILAEGEGAEGIVAALRYSFEDTLKRLASQPLVITELLQKESADFKVAQIIQLASKDLYGDLGIVLSEIRRLQYAGYRLYVSFFSEEKRERFIRILVERNYDAPFVVHRDAAFPPDIEAAASSPSPDTASPMHLVLSSHDRGMIFPTFKAALITESELFAQKKRQSRPRAAMPGIKAFSELNPGDYVVHDYYGIGVFAGIQQIVTDGNRRDYLRINYAGSDVLYIPVESAGSIRKYIGADTDKVKVSNMGGLAWKNQVSRARKGIEDIADDLLELYAKRQSKIGFAYGPDTPWQQEFEDLFPYEETPDQIKAAEEIKRDMERSMPMDRLLSGDVGYGKTEVALRAAFKAVSASKQVAFLVPTTVLAQQHFTNIKERFSKYPVKIEMISRFRSAAEINKILARVKTGEVDILIGTHRLLSKDVKFKDLGLLVVDEEQRFGVKHKESIKMLKENVDVLTLTATPIPRTLHMSILGVRDMSVLEDPPAERSPVQTYVMEYNLGVVREAILREVERGGQVYYVYNRIEGIERIADELREMLPGVSICTAHGRMGEEALERIMLDFMEGKFDVLVSTTIIETGLDISNVNTMIVRSADMLGLSQLYQLRGRVGRSSRRGFCYAFFQKGKQLTEVQERRLRAIREFTDLGAGFKIAMKDLEIRGAGNLLGTAQSGFMENIGYDMFVRILDETLRKRKGEDLGAKVEAKIELKINAYIPDDYVSDSQARIDIYKQISALEVQPEIPVADVARTDDGNALPGVKTAHATTDSAQIGTDAAKSFAGGSLTDALARELEDKYGALPHPLVSLLEVAEMKVLCEGMGISLVREQAGMIFLRFDENKRFDIYKMGEMLGACKEVTYCTGKAEELRMAKPEGEGWLGILAKTVRKVYNYLM